MKNILLTAVVLFGLLSCKNAGEENASLARAEKDTANYTSIEWLDPLQNVGTLKFGDKTKIRFRFENTGDKPLFIISATPGCGCTVADFPKQAISPGSTGEVVAEFDTNKGHEGHFNKAVSVKANTKETTLHNLVFEGDIIKEGEGGNAAADSASNKNKN